MYSRSVLFHLLAIIVVVALGAGLDVMEVDAAQYAGMSRDMMVSGDVLQLHYRGGDYLDKPPLLFWLSSLSFKLFGVYDWSYRLPSILFAFLGLYATYRFTLLYHAREVAIRAMLMYGCSAAFFLMCNDVRCDTILTGSVMTAIWLGCAWLEQGKWRQLIGLSVAVAAGMLAKGPIGAVVPALAIGGQLVFTRKWHKLLDPRWLVVLLIIGALLLPMCIGLYQQHGWHGVRFYFWEQSFGRITGENRWKDDSTVFFFTHEVLWQLLPWTIAVLVGLWSALRSMVLRTHLPEYASMVGAVLTFVALSLSQFKLPHYLFVTVPLFAVVAARGSFLLTGWLQRAHLILAMILWLVLSWLTYAVFPEARWPFFAFTMAMGVVVLLFVRRTTADMSVLLVPFWIMIALGVVLNGQFYPNVLRYQANAKAGQWAAAQGVKPGEFHTMQVSGGAIDYYAGYPVPWLSNAAEARDAMAPGLVIYTDANHRQELLDAGLVPDSELELLNFPAQRLSIPFLFPSSRTTVLEPRFLLRYDRP